MPIFDPACVTRALGPLTAAPRPRAGSIKPATARRPSVEGDSLAQTVFLGQGTIGDARDRQMKAAPSGNENM
ncbi:MAG: hypothetical protein RL385_1379 [Pseudomonadota bacterium]|jgi:hypothetical protein